MEFKEAIKALNGANKGGIHTVKTVKQISLKGGTKVTKETVMQLRMLQNYYNQKSVMKKHASGERQVCPKAWAQSMGNGIIKHITKGTLYLCGQPTGNKPHTVYMLDGQPCTYEMLEPSMYSKDKRKKSKDYEKVKSYIKRKHVPLKRAKKILNLARKKYLTPDWITPALDTVEYIH